MRWSEKSIIIAAAVASFCVVGFAFAQDKSNKAPFEAISNPREQTLTPREMLNQANSYKRPMESSTAGVRQQLGAARRQRDVVKALCLGDKLNQIELATRTANDRIDGLKAAVSFGDAERSKHEFTVIQVLRDRVATLVSEANQCIGEETGFVGESSIKVTIDPSIPATDPTQPPIDPVVSTPPVLTTPSS